MAVDAIAREAALFAAVGLLIGGLDDLLVDLIHLLRPRAGSVPPGPAPPLRYAILLPAWDEAVVIGPMLRTALDRIGGRDARIYVGLYPNDPATIRAAADVAERDDRIRLVIGMRAGPTTKGCNLNTLWGALIRDQAAEGWAADAIVLHDAEDVLDPAELVTFDRFLTDFDYVQLPVLPLIARDSRWVSAHYADEFAEAHRRNLAVRQRLGAGLPLAGVGCAIRRSAIARVAEARGGQPFDPESLTEDYELGLALSASGARGCFAEVRDGGGRRVAVRAFFPAALDAAVRQKARWMNGIALLGWDRLGWRGARRPGELWMRMRDRRAPLAMLVLAAAYLALAAGGVAVLLRLAVDVPSAAISDGLEGLLFANSLLLLWRLGSRMVATGRVYGWREGLRAGPRVLVANLIGLAAARRALTGYVRSLRGAAPAWDKTAHAFPDLPDAIR